MARDNWGGGPAQAKSEANNYIDDNIRGGKAGRQFAHTGSGDPTGGNLSGDGENAQASHPLLLKVAPFQGRSGQPDNQSTLRPKGST